ncbi:MAG: ABC transporter permease [Acidimicrobiia bacterium]
MSAVTMDATVGKPTGQASAWRTVRVLAWRSLRKVTRTRQLVFFSLVQPIVFLALFSQVFRSIKDTPGFPEGITYIDHLVPAILITSIATYSTQSGISMATDLTSGVMDRFRSLPIPRAAVPLARSVADLARSSVQTVAMIIVSMLLFGFRFHGNLAETLGVLVVAAVFGWSLSWLYIAIGTATRNVEVTQMAGFLVNFPLMFASSAFVPSRNLPDWLEGFTGINPLSLAVDASRSLALGWPWGDDVLRAAIAAALVAILGMVGVFFADRASARQG